MTMLVEGPLEPVEQMTLEIPPLAEPFELVVAVTVHQAGQYRTWAANIISRKLKLEASDNGYRLRLRETST